MPRQLERPSIRVLLKEFHKMRQKQGLDLLPEPSPALPPLGSNSPAASANDTGLDLAQVGRLLAGARVARFRSQRELADETGIDHTTIARLERGQANPTMVTLQRLAAALGKQLRVLIVDAPQDEPPADPPRTNLGSKRGRAKDTKTKDTRTAEQLAVDREWESLLAQLPEPPELRPLPSLEELFGVRQEVRGEGLD